MRVENNGPTLPSPHPTRAPTRTPAPRRHTSRARARPLPVPPSPAAKPRAVRGFLHEVSKFRAGHLTRRRESSEAAVATEALAHAAAT